MRRRSFIKAAGLIAGVVAVGNPVYGRKLFRDIQASVKKPNIIFILSYNSTK